jgi:hypothetical protein
VKRSASAGKRYYRTHHKPPYLPAGDRERQAIGLQLSHFFYLAIDSVPPELVHADGHTSSPDQQPELRRTREALEEMDAHNHGQEEEDWTHVRESAWLDEHLDRVP